LIYILAIAKQYNTQNTETTLCFDLEQRAKHPYFALRA